MTSTESVAGMAVPVEEIQKGWHELMLRVSQLETERSALEQDNKALRSLLERTIEHRQKSHGELVLLLTGLVGKLPINDVAVVVSKLVEHNAHVSATCAALAKGKTEAAMPQLSILKALDQTKRDLAAALKPAIDELIQLEAPLETNMLRSLVTDPESFFAPAVVRANRCFAKGQLPRERIVREFGTEALVFFNDLTTDPKLNPRPKPEEIVLGFKSDFEALFQQNPALIPDHRQELLALHQKVQRSKAATEQARLQKNVFQKISFILELLHYYENQSTEAPDVVFAQRLPGLVEQLVVTGPQDSLDEKALLQAEALLAFVINPDHRLMTINNMGKNGGTAKTLKYTLKLRTPQLPDQGDALAEFVRHLFPAAAKILPQPTILARALRLLPPDIQRLMVGGIMSFDKLRRDEAHALGRSVAKELGITGLDEIAKAAAPAMPVEMERQMAWEKVKELIKQRGEPAVVAAAIRDRLHAKYDGDEIKESWLTLIQTDPMSLIRTFCHLPYLADGRTDPIARTVMETYISRLTHEKYGATYTKVVNSLKNMFQAKPDSPTLINFLALVKWVDPEAASKLSVEIGMPPAH